MSRSRPRRARALFIAALALAAWQRDRRRLAGALGAAEGTRERMEAGLARAKADAEDAHERQQRAEARLAEQRGAAERERRQSDQRLQAEQRGRAMTERARQAERSWAQELRSQIVRLQHERGALSDPDDVPGLVLQTALSLLGAEKGLLFGRQDGGEGLRVVRHLGFDHDPADSAIARSFAERVLVRDETFRENDPATLDAASRGPADDEIHNVLAIPIYLRDEFTGAVVCANAEDGFDEYGDDVLIALGDHAGSVLDNARLRGELRSAYIATVQMLGEAISARDPFVGGHSREVSGYVAAVATRLGIDPRRREELMFGSLLHDIGKLGISERILLKPAKLTPEERAIVELHPRIGYRLVSRIPALEPIATGVLHHHERFDGTGYPARLHGEQIPIEARIICVADAFSAMTQDRPYRARMSLDDACVELETCAGTQFDAEVVRTFVDEVRRRPDAWEDGDLGHLGNALGDTELTLHRADGEPLLGSGTLAIIDNLTLLYSHRHLHETVAAEAQRSEVQSAPFAVIFISLEGLSALNLREGHAAGDAAILAAARAVQRAASRCAGTACRHGGDRLALVVPGADETAAATCVTHLLEDWPDLLEARVGVAVWRAGERGPDVIARARLELGGTR